MKYILNSGAGWDHRPYWRYLETEGELLPISLRTFASDTHNHDLVSPNSLHDAWLEYWKVSETSMRDNRKKRDTRVECCLLGPRHDRLIRLTYNYVSRQQILWPQEDTRSLLRTHGDLLVHEVTVSKDGVFCHELLFSSGASFIVEFREFEHRVDLLL